MTSRALNSGPLNAVSFPLSEEGLSLIQLTGTVEVVCNVSILGVRRFVQASGTASARGTASMIFKTQAAAITPATATTRAGVRLKTTNNSAKVTAKAIAASDGYALRRASAIQPARAIVSAKAFVKVFKSAHATPTADTNTFEPIIRVPRTATTHPSAVCRATALIKAPRAATTVARGKNIASITLKSRLRATVAPSALGLASTLRKSTAAATTIARAITSANTLRKRRVAATVAAQAQIGQTLAALRYRFAATTVAQAIAADARVVFELQLGAQTTAQAIARSAATDYGIAVPAPQERLMFVPASERTMEVTE